MKKHKMRRGGGGGGERSGASGASGGVGSVEKVDAEVIMAFVRTRECRRAIMSRYLDGKETQCGDVEGAAACDRCGESRAE
jgi:hypothetical protein